MKNDENLFRIVELNYKDLNSKIDDSLSKLKNSNLYSAEQEFLHLDINRLILNYLSSIRTYLDHSETRLKRNHKSDSNLLKIFKDETSNAYDNQFAYRFLYKLRNYSQHCGLPAGFLSTSSYVENDEEIKHSINLSLLRDELLNNFEWGNPITEELKSQNEQFNILPFVETKFALLKDINDKLNNLSYENHKEDGIELLNILNSLENANGSPALLKTIDVDGQMNIEFQWFPLELITKVTRVQIL